MATKTAAGLVKFVKNALAEGWGYVYGAYGQKCTKSLLDYYASMYPANNLAGGEMRKVGEKWIGKIVADCSGLIKAYRYEGTGKTYDVDIDTTTNYSAAKTKGTIDTLPEIPGILVYMPGHVGVYVGGGVVIESAGTYYGVRQSTKERSYTGQKWTHWYECPGIEYSKDTERPDENKPDIDEKPVNPTPSNKKIDVEYRVRGKRGKWYPAVKNMEDYAGVVGDAITDVAIKVSAGSVKYRVHIKGDSWLPWVTGYSLSDHNNGYAGNGKFIDAIQVYYYTPDDIRPLKKAVYRVSPLKKGYYSFQYDTETGNGQDGYAGSFGKSIDRFQIKIE